MLKISSAARPPDGPAAPSYLDPDHTQSSANLRGQYEALWGTALMSVAVWRQRGFVVRQLEFKILTQVLAQILGLCSAQTRPSPPKTGRRKSPALEGQMMRK